MARVFAFTQFIIVSLGALALHLLVRLDDRMGPPETAAVFAAYVARYALWLFAVPILYGAVGSALEGKVNATAIKGVGLALCLILLVVFGWPILHHLS